MRGKLPRIQVLAISSANDRQVIDRMRWLTIVLPALFFLALLFLSVEVFDRLLPGALAVAVVFTLGVGGIVVFSRSVFAVIERFQNRLREQNRDLEQRTQQLSAVYQAGLHVSSNLRLSAVLQDVVDSSRQLVRARYGALAVVENGRILEFITSGLSEKDKAAIGAPPQGRGLLGYVLSSGRPYRSSDIAADPRAGGFPPHHPMMKTFLGLPIVSAGKVIGDLYLADKLDGDFTAEDEEAIQTLAVQAAIAIENARLYKQVQEMAILRERERIGMDLHDGAIQSLYGVGLKLDSCIERVEVEPAAVRRELDRAIEDLNTVIRNIRSYIFDLRPHELEGRSLRDSLAELLLDLSVNTLISTELLVDNASKGQDPSQRLATEQTIELFHIAHEALANVRKHSRAKNVRAEIGVQGGIFTMRIVDDGVGISRVSRPRNGAGKGLANMAERIRALGGGLRITELPEGGTIVSVSLPLELAAEAFSD